MTRYNCDLHYHSPYAAACSKNITVPVLAKEAIKKGLDILTTADILHPEWRKHVIENIIEENGCFRYKEIINNKKVFFILGTEVETENRIHHLLYFKDFLQIENFEKEIKDFCQDMAVYGSGRTKLKTTAEKLLNICKQLGIIIGPAHAFTPYFGIYAHFDSLKEAYGKNWDYVKFIELGLSADALSANTIPELKNISFFSFSDSHSPLSYRIGREYVCMDLESPNFSSLEKVLEKKEGKIIYNVGYNPKEGKYNLTACRSCHQKYTLKQAIENNWKCPLCKKTIKKGVVERIKEISQKQGNKELKQIVKRPEYKHLIPLAQVIQIAINEKNINHKRVIDIYERFIEKYTEIEIMQEVCKKELEKINPDIAKYIMAFRKDFVVFQPGGAGAYGEPYIFFTEKEKLDKQNEIEKNLYLKDLQKKLFLSLE
jgi:uncharacterized protein (TIGR00375 family)